jgi:hypothetical protein
MAKTKVIEKKEQQFTLSQSPALLTYPQAQQLIPVDELYNEASDFYWGDQWREGKSWTGPALDEDEEDATDVMAEIEKSYVTSSALEEVTDRRKDAILGRPATWSIALRRDLAPEEEAPTDQEQRLIDEANAALVEWYDDKDVLSVLDNAQLDLELGKRGLARLIVPEGELVMADDGSTAFPNGRTFRECMRALWPVHAPADQAVVLRDSMTMREVGMFVYEVQDVQTGRPVQLAEISYVDDDGNTVIKVVGETQPKRGTKKQPVEFGSVALLPLGGRLPIFEMRSPKPLITQPLLDNQKGLNMSLTMMDMNVVLAGFLERVITSGQRPGDWIDEETKEVVPANTPGSKFVPLPYKTGPRTTQWIQPALLGVDREKKPIFQSPSVEWRDPVTVDTFVKTQDVHYTNILQAAHQLHVIISGDAVASGESRKQARDDYEKMLKKDKVRLDKLGQWLLETALWWAAILEGKPGRFSGLRVVYDTKVDAGPIAAVDRAAMREEVDASLRSRENYMVEARVTDDPEAETATIVEESATDDPIQQIKARRDAAKLLLQQASTVNPADKQNPGGSNPGGGTGGGGSGTGTRVRRGTGRSQPKVKV